jgi:hypothetical protein
MWDADPKFGIDCLGKVNSVYADDRELMIKFYDFVSREEMACEEAELGPEAFKQKMEHVKKIQQQVSMHKTVYCAQSLDKTLEQRLIWS